MNVQLLKEITDPREIVDNSKYRYWYKMFKGTGRLFIQDGFENIIGGDKIKVYKELINKKIIKRII
jgi:hypothetical protein